MFARRASLMVLAALVCAGVSTQSAHAAADLSTPKGAAVALAKGVMAGDNAAIREASTGTEEEYKTAEAMGTVMSSMLKFANACETKFGKDNVLSKSFAGQIPDLGAKMEASEIKVEGDTATVIDKDKPNDESPMKLKKVGGSWKVDLSSMDADAKQFAVAGLKLAAVFNKAAEDINAGKYKSAEEAAVAIAPEMQKALQN